MESTNNNNVVTMIIKPDDVFGDEVEPVLDVGRQHADHGAGNVLFANIPSRWAETEATLQLENYWMSNSVQWQ